MDQNEDIGSIFNKKMTWNELAELLPCGIETEKHKDQSGKVSYRVSLKIDSLSDVQRSTGVQQKLEIRKIYLEIYHTLTKREKEIISYIVDGYNNSEIAAALFISRRTIEQHRKNIRRKFNYQNDFELLKFARAFDLVQ